MNDVFRMLVFFGLMAPAFASQTLDALVSAAANFSAAIQQQLATIQSNPSPARLAEKTIEYAQAKTAYCQALRAAMPELINIATGRQARPPELDKFATAFAISDEKQEKVADQKTMTFLKRFSRNPNVEKARQDFESAQKVEEQFQRAKMAPAPLWRRVTADNELLGFGDLEFYPRTAASAAFVSWVRAFGGQLLEAKLCATRSSSSLVPRTSPESRISSGNPL